MVAHCNPRQGDSVRGPAKGADCSESHHEGSLHSARDRVPLGTASNRGGTRRAGLWQRPCDKRARNRTHGADELLHRSIPFLSKNGGAHLIVNPEHPSKRADYWPGTGLWRSYWGSHEGRGFASLLKWLG